jgi:branched-chain amino acid aminotransferase
MLDEGDRMPPDALTVALRETIRVQDGRIPLLERHLARLRAGGCDERVLDAARDAALEAASAWTAIYGRMTLLVAVDGQVSVEITDHPSTIVVPGGPIAAIVETGTPELPAGAAKPADRSFWDEALHRAQTQGAHVAILVDHEGHLVDGSQATLWLVIDGELHTPPSPPALAGVSRGVVFDLASRLRIPARERAMTASDFAQAEEAFFTTAVAGAVPVRERGGSVAARIARAFESEFTLE